MGKVSGRDTGGRDIRERHVGETRRRGGQQEVCGLSVQGRYVGYLFGKFGRERWDKDGWDRWVA